MSIEVVESNVVLLAAPSTLDGKRLSGIAAKFCTSADTIAEILDADDTYESCLKRVTGYGHLSVTEMDWWCFGIENVSRTLTHQLVRKRLASYAQESMRYASQGGTYKIIVPDSLKGKRYPVRLFDDPNSELVYLSLEDLAAVAHEWYEAAQEDGVPNEDARFGLLEASKTKIFVGMNSHALLDFFNERTCTTAQWEIRNVAQKMMAIAKDLDPTVFANAGPKCVRAGHCVEVKAKWENCRRFPHKSDLDKAMDLEGIEFLVNNLDEVNRFKLIARLTA
jgi:thymidylate synthase (FAD)